MGPNETSGKLFSVVIRIRKVITGIIKLVNLLLKHKCIIYRIGNTTDKVKPDYRAVITGFS